MPGGQPSHFRSRWHEFNPLGNIATPLDGSVRNEVERAPPSRHRQEDRDDVDPGRFALSSFDQSPSGRTKCIMATWSPTSMSPSSSPTLKRAKWGASRGCASPPRDHTVWEGSPPAHQERPRPVAGHFFGSSNPSTSAPDAHTGMDSGFSEGATPPTSLDDSQDSFPAHAHGHTSRPMDLLNDDDLSNTIPDAIDFGITSGLPQSEESSHACLPPDLPDPTLGLEPAEPEPHPGPSRTTQEDNDEDDRLSDVSGISDMSGSEWKSTAGPMSWVQAQMMKGADPRELLQSMISSDSVIPDDIEQLTLWKIILNMLSEPPRRKKLDFVNTLGNVVELIKKSRNIVVLTGAGVSVSCGIPDFRSRDGVYARLAVDFPDLPDPQAMFDIQYFRKDPRPFFKFAREIYPGQFKPSPCHRFIRSLEKHKKLLRNYTQNIDTLEQVVGIENVIQCHGSFASATCTKCRHTCNAESIKSDIFDQRIPYCPVCVERLTQEGVAFDPTNLPVRTPPPASPTLPCPAAPSPPVPSADGEPPQQASLPPTPKVSFMYEHPSVPGIMKPDIVFFGEGLGDEFHNSVAKDKNDVDLLVMIGSSLKVRPVALIPSSIPLTVPQILINREPLSHLTPDVELLGDCDGIINQICSMLGTHWEEPVHQEPLSETLELASRESEAPASLETTTPEGGLEGDSNTSSSSQASWWQSKKRESLSRRLPQGSYYFQPPSRYVFPGAELFSDSDSSDSSDEDNDDGDESDDEAGAPSPSAYGTHHTPGPQAEGGKPDRSSPAPASEPKN
eukprot:maker-scaffold1280_size50848-snap-gene-0.9 protein:Tk06597 transcript:maker-scaffold1280_size50848-snap-gene-0.9-mRNA-1 annotation:"nad-dependent deacetylase sirtuin-1"